MNKCCATIMPTVLPGIRFLSEYLWKKTRECEAKRFLTV